MKTQIKARLETPIKRKGVVYHGHANIYVNNERIGKFINIHKGYEDREEVRQRVGKLLAGKPVGDTDEILSKHFK